jgi:hypothetical protein
MKLAVKHWVATASWIGVNLAASAWIARSVAAPLAAPLSQFPNADRELFAPGGELLLEVLRAEAPQLAVAFKTSLLEFGIWHVFALVPLGALVACFAAPKPLRLIRALARGVTAFPSLFLLTGVGWLLRALVLATLGPIAAALQTSLSAHHGDPTGDTWALVALLGMGAAFLAIGVLEDFARVLVVCHAEDSAERESCHGALAASWTATLSAARALRRQLFGVLRDRVALALGSFAAVTASIYALSVTGFAPATTPYQVLVVCVEMASLVMLFGLRAVWLASLVARAKFAGSPVLPVAR